MRARSSRIKRNDSAKKYAHRAKEADLVRQRWERNGNVCEGCGESVDLIEIAHVFGRRNLIAEPMASWKELCAPLCCARTRDDGNIGCHEKYDQAKDSTLRETLQSAAFQRLCDRLKIGEADREYLLEHFDYAEACRTVLKQLGYQP